MMKVCKVDPNNIFGNWVYVSDKDYDPNQLVHGLIKETTIQLKPVPWIQQGCVGLNLVQRQFFNASEGSELEVTVSPTLAPLKEVVIQLIHNNKPLENIPDEQTNKYMDYVYHGLFMTSLSEKHPAFIIPHPFNDDDVVIVNVLEKKDTLGIVNNDTDMNLVH